MSNSHPRVMATTGNRKNVVDKQLIIVIEGTGYLGMHWSSILSNYLMKIIRVFCGGESVEQSNVMLQLVMFYDHGSYGPMRSGWIRDRDSFIDRLKSMRFSGGGLSAPATTNGLEDALMMFAVPANGYKTEENIVGKRHCILVAANDPFPLPVPVYRPNFDNCGDPSPCHDAETVAGWFGRCSVSLSVISPRKSPRLRALFKAGKRNLNSEDKPVWNQHPNFLVLISEDFKEARVALSSTIWAEYQIANSQSHPESGASTTYQQVKLPVSKPFSSEKASTSLIPESKAVTETSQHVKNSALSTSSATKCVTKVSSLDPIQSSSNLQRSNTVVGPTESSLNQTKTVKLEGFWGTNLVTTTNFGLTDVVSSTKVPVLGMPQQLDIKEKSVNLNYSAVSVPVSQEAPNLPYVKVWEGNLVHQKQGKTTFITRLEAYTRPSSLAMSNAADWPDSITVAHTMLKDYIKHEYNIRRGVLLVFRVLDQQTFVSHLLEKNHCAVVKLPCQMLLLTAPNNPGRRLLGMLTAKPLSLTPQPSSASPAATATGFEAATSSAEHQQG